MRQQKNSWYLVWILSKTDFHLRYHGSILGFLWAILKPLFIFLILNFVFSHLFGGSVSYSLGLLTGLIIWNFFSEGSMTGLGALLSKGHILKKINAPTWTMVVASSLTSFYTFLLSLGILAAFFVAYGVIPHPLAILACIPYLIILYGVILALGFLLAPLYVVFRDMNQIWEVLLNAGFYATPIIYPATSLPANVRDVLMLNPLSIIIEGCKELLLNPFTMEHVVTNLMRSLYLGVATLVCLLLAFAFFRIRSRGIAEYV